MGGANVGSRGFADNDPTRGRLPVGIFVDGGGMVHASGSGGGRAGASVGTIGAGGSGLGRRGISGLHQSPDEGFKITEAGADAPSG